MTFKKSRCYNKYRKLRNEVQKMLEKTRNAMATDIVLALEFPFDADNDILVVKTARDIFHTEWYI